MNNQQSLSTAIAIALQFDTDNNDQTNTIASADSSFSKNLSALMAINQIEDDIPQDELEKRVIQQQGTWINYFKDIRRQLNEALQLFESYDQKKHLSKYIQKIKTKKTLNQYAQSKFLELLTQYAFEAFKNKTWNDAYLMFFFITIYFPFQLSSYSYLGKIMEELKGLDQASEYYASTSQILQDPELYFRAANCEMNRNNQDKAKEYLLKLKEILDNASGLSDENQKLLQETNKILELMEQEA